jgi:hypothetical protein
MTCHTSPARHQDRRSARSDPAATEELTCQVVGDEFFDRLEKHDGGG